MNPKKTGLVLAGGGARGSYEIGVLKTLASINRTFDVVAGTSIGALCGAMYVSGHMKNMEEWIAGTKGSLASRNLFMFPNQYKTAPLAGKPINDFLDVFTQNGPSIAASMDSYKALFSYEDFMKSSMDFACATYNVTQARPEVFYKKDMSEADCLPKLIASTAYFPCYNLAKVGDDYYLDGGYWNTVPVSVAKEMGAQDILAVALEDPFTVLNFDPAGIEIMRPILRLASTMDFEGETMARQIQQGALEAMKYLNLAPGYLYTFYKEDWDHIQILEKLVLELMVTKGKISLLEELPKTMDEIYAFILGYVPQPLENAYSSQFIFGRLLEVMGLVAGIDVYQQIHFKDFMKQLLEKLEEFDSNPNLIEGDSRYQAMEMKGLKDLLVFFHSAMVSYDMKLPASFDIFKQGNFRLPYYFAAGDRKSVV